MGDRSRVRGRGSWIVCERAKVVGERSRIVGEKS